MCQWKTLMFSRRGAYISLKPFSHVIVPDSKRLKYMQIYKWNKVFKTPKG